MNNVAALLVAGTLGLSPMPMVVDSTHSVGQGTEFSFKAEPAEISSSAPLTIGPFECIRPPESVFKDDILWSKALVVCERVRMSPYTEKVEEATKICWVLGLKKDGTVIWKEVKE